MWAVKRLIYTRFHKFAPTHRSPEKVEKMVRKSLMRFAQLAEPVAAFHKAVISSFLEKYLCIAENFRNMKWMANL